MGGYLVCCLSLLGVLMFSGSMFFMDSLSMLWLSLELSSLSLIPAYFIVVRPMAVFSSLFCYFMISGVSSAMIIVGFMYDYLMIVSFCGVLLKLGVFPFMLWVYVVMSSSNWFVVWEYSTVLKCVVFVLPYVFGYELASSAGVSWLVCIMFLLLSLFFWVFTYSWKSCWCHMLLASTGLMIMTALCCVTSNLLFLFLVYLVWSSQVIVLFSFWGGSLGERDLVWWFFYCFLLVSHPMSFSVAYKLISVYCVSSFSIFVMSCWLLYSLSEQLFLIMWAINYKHPRSCFWFVWVVVG
uniref:NADH dehydrogenase subunit 2 n=1 Tax=Eurytrema pancreaticum TaxID=374591 RepID=A0A0E3U340_EUTPN|nr:NADH dehydrogenase subunit 2 [Eurytrema pancreaticum]